MEKDIKEMEYHGPGWHEALWFPSSRQVTFSLIGFILLVYIAKSCLRDLPLGGILLTMVLFAIPASISCAYHITIQKTIRSLTFTSNGVIGTFNSGRLFTIIRVILCSLVGSVVIICSILTINSVDFFVICIGVVVFPFIYKFVFSKIRQEASLWVCYNCSLTWTKRIVICIIVAIEFLLAYLGFYDLPVYPDLQTALDARDIPGTSSAFINYIIGISSILSATKKYFLSCIAHTQGGIFEFLLSSLACVATFYYYIVAIRVLFIPVSEIRRIFISKCIPSFDIPKIKPITIFIYSFVLSISIFLFVYTVAYMDRALQDETIATIASSVEKKAENVAIEMDGAFYKGEFVKTYRYINAEYSRRIENIDKQLLASHEIMCRKMEGNVDKFLDWYYSLTAEYLRLFNVLSGTADEFMREKFKEHLEDGFDFGWVYDKIQEREALQAEWRSKLQYMKQQYMISAEGAKSKTIVRLSPDFLQLTPSREFVNWHTRMGTGAVSGITAGIAAKALSKSTGKLAVSALAKALASKGVGLGASVLAGAGTGAATGSVVPGFGTVAGGVAGVVGGAAIWVLTDSALLFAEEKISREDFRQELLASVREMCR